MPLITITILPCISIFHTIHYHERVLWTAAYNMFVRQYRNPMIVIPTLPSLMPPSLANIAQFG